MRNRTACTIRNAASTPARFAQLRKLLEGRRREIQDRIHDRLAAVREERTTADHVSWLDDGEVADVDVQEDIELALMEMQRETLERLDAALRRLDEGLYGYCSECGDDISAARLRALPFAVRCVDCESAREAEAATRRSPVTAAHGDRTTAWHLRR